MSIVTIIDRLAFLQQIENPTEEEINEMDSLEDEIEQLNHYDEPSILRHGGQEW